MFKFKKFKIELYPSDAMALSEFLNLVGSNYDVGDDLVACFSRFIHAVNEAGLKSLPNDGLLLPECYDILGSDGTGKLIEK